MLGSLAAVSSSSMLNVSSVGMWAVLCESEESCNRTTVGQIVHRRSSTGTAQCHLRQCFLHFSPVLTSFVILGLRSGPMWPAVGVSAPTLRTACPEHVGLSPLPALLLGFLFVRRGFLLWVRPRISPSQTPTSRLAGGLPCRRRAHAKCRSLAHTVLCGAAATARPGLSSGGGCSWPSLPTPLLPPLTASGWAWAARDRGPRLGCCGVRAWAAFWTVKGLESQPCKWNPASSLWLEGHRAAATLAVPW